MELIAGLFPTGIIFAICGGMLGSIWASFEDHDSFGRSVLEALIALVAAAAAAEEYLPVDKIWVCGIGGVIIGLLVGHALDIIKIMAPKVIQSSIEAFASKFLGYKKDGKDACE